MHNHSVNIMLKKPSSSDEESVWELRSAFLASGSGKHIPGSCGLGLAASYSQWFTNIQAFDTHDHNENARVPSTIYIAVRPFDGRVVGILDIRHRLNAHLLKTGGHVGYSVHPLERRKGYATEMLRQAIGICADMHMPRILVTCDKSNIASAAVITANGGELESEILGENGLKQRYWIKT